MEGVEEDSQSLDLGAWVGADQAGDGGGGQRMWSLRTPCVGGVWGHPGGGDEQTFGRSWGEPGTPGNKPANPISIHRNGDPVLSPRRAGAPGSRGCLHLLRHLHRRALPHCAQLRPTEGGLPAWEGAMGVASPRPDVRASTFSFT